MSSETKIAIGVAALAIVYGAYRYNALSKSKSELGITDEVLRAEVLKRAQSDTIQRATEGDEAAAADINRMLISARANASVEEKV